MKHTPIYTPFNLMCDLHLLRSGDTFYLTNKLMTYEVIRIVKDWRFPHDQAANFCVYYKYCNGLGLTYITKSVYHKTKQVFKL